DAIAQLFLADGDSSIDAARRATAVPVIADAFAHEPSLMSVPSVAGPLALSLDRLPHGVERDRLLDQIARVATSSGDATTMPALLLALIDERLVADTEPVPLLTSALQRN